MMKRMIPVALWVAFQSLLWYRSEALNIYRSSSFSPLSFHNVDVETTACHGKDSYLRRHPSFVWNSRGGALSLSQIVESTEDDDDGRNNKVDVTTTNDNIAEGSSWNDDDTNVTSYQQQQYDGVIASVFDAVSIGRYACTRFEQSNNATIQRQAMYCLNLARRAPSGFNVQPYRMIFVHTPKAKEALSKYCLGRNADRVLDSDCTVVFLADKQCARDFDKLEASIIERQTAKLNYSSNNNKMKWSNFTRQKEQLEWKRKHKWMIRKIKALVLLFSSGYPLPRFISNPISWAVRLGVSTVSVLTRRRVLVPSLGTAETWAVKNTMLVAMSFMLGCTSRGLATCPMEGFNVGGVRAALNIPRRYAIPLIVSVGLPYQPPQQQTNDHNDQNDQDDTGMAHGSLLTNGKKGNHVQATTRYPLEETIFGDHFDGKLQLLP